MKKIILSIVIISCITFLLAFIIINPSRLNDIYFWVLSIWLLVLILVNYAASFGLFGDFGRHSSKLIGGLPSISGVILIGSLISAFLAFQSYFLVIENDLLKRYNFFFQILTIGITSTIVLFISLAAKFAETGSENLVSREQLVKKINNLLIQSDALKDKNLSKILKNINDYVRYRMPHPSSVDKSEYNEIVSRLDLISRRELTSEMRSDLESLLNQVKSL